MQKRLARDRDRDRDRDRERATWQGRITREQIVINLVESNDSPEIPDSGDNINSRTPFGAEEGGGGEN